MNSIKILTFTFLLFSGISQSFAAEMFYSGSETGNGGDVVVCRNDSNAITSVTTLDYFEAKALYGFDVSLEGNDFNQKLDFAISKLKNISSLRQSTFSKWKEDFFQESNFVNYELVDIPDSNHKIVPKNCKIEQIVIQQEPQFPEEKRYLVNKDLWDRLDELNKAGIILHELIYRETISFGATNSVGARYFNGLISSHGIDRYLTSKNDLIDIFYKIRLGYIEFDNINYSLYRLMRSSGGIGWFRELLVLNKLEKVTVGWALEGSIYKTPEMNISLHGNVSFCDNGKPQRLSFEGNKQYLKLKNNQELIIGSGDNYARSSGELLFSCEYKDLDLDLAMINESDKVLIKSYGREISLEGVRKGDLSFNSRKPDEISSIKFEQINIFTDPYLQEVGLSNIDGSLNLRDIKKVNYSTSDFSDIAKVGVFRTIALSKNWSNIKYRWKNPWSPSDEEQDLYLEGVIEFNNKGHVLRSTLSSTVNIEAQGKKFTISAAPIEFRIDKSLYEVTLRRDVELKDINGLISNYPEDSVVHFASNGLTYPL